MLLLAFTGIDAQQISLQQAVDLAQKQGYQSRAAVATRDAARAKDHAFGARLLPQISLVMTAPDYQRSITPVQQGDGSTEFKPVEQTTQSAGLSVEQKVPLTGGTFSITSSLQRVNRTGVAQSYASAPVLLRVSQPVMRPNEYRWQDREQTVQLEVSERQFVEARETIALQATNAFFDFFIAKKQLDNARSNTAINDTLFTLNKGRLEIGKIGENDLLQSELAMLRARSAYDNATLEFQRTLSALRLAINLPTTPLDVAVPSAIPQFTADTTTAVAQALRNRAQISELELQDVQARHGVARAKLNNGLGATVDASFGLNQTANDFNLAYQNPQQAQRFTLGLRVPLVQWGARSADVQAAVADQKRVEATSRATREQLAQEAHFAALQLTQATRNVAVSAKADTVAAKRFEVAYNRYVIGRIGIDNLYIAQNEKDQAVTQYLQALRAYWTAYYRLRQVTLYDFEKGAPLR